MFGLGHLSSNNRRVTYLESIVTRALKTLIVLIVRIKRVDSVTVPKALTIHFVRCVSLPLQ